MPYQRTVEAERQARSKLAAIEAGHILVSQTCAAWLCGVTPQAIANRAASPLYVIDGRKMFRLSDIGEHDGGRVAEAMESAWTIAIDGVVWAVGIMPTGRPRRWDEAAS